MYRGKRELILQLSAFSRRFLLHRRGTIILDGAPRFEWWNYVITDFQTFAFLMLMLKISRDRGRPLVVTCPSQKHLIIRTKYDEKFKCHIQRLSGFRSL
jgi:hypothetical protein